MLIGLDFDNTIAGYDRAFWAAGVAMGMLTPDDPMSKSKIRSLLRGRADGETLWQRLQGRVYGRQMPDAVLMPGVVGFLECARQRGAPVVVVSHKTEFGHFDPERVNLRQAALGWMESQGLLAFDRTGLSMERVHFLPTRQDKVARIADLGCTHFIDDLPEVFEEPGFPPVTKSYLLGDQDGAWVTCRDFAAVTRAIFHD